MAVFKSKLKFWVESSARCFGWLLLPPSARFGAIPAADKSKKLSGCSNHWGCPYELFGYFWIKLCFHVLFYTRFCVHISMWAIIEYFYRAVTFCHFLVSWRHQLLGAVWGCCSITLLHSTKGAFCVLAATCLASLQQAGASHMHIHNFFRLHI